MPVGQELLLRATVVMEAIAHGLMGRILLVVLVDQEVLIQVTVMVVVEQELMEI